MDKGVIDIVEPGRVTFIRYTCRDFIVVNDVGCIQVVLHDRFEMEVHRVRVLHKAEGVGQLVVDSRDRRHLIVVGCGDRLVQPSQPAHHHKPQKENKCEFVVPDPNGIYANSCAAPFWPVIPELSGILRYTLGCRMAL